jgi:hypothetical protein
VAVSTQCIVTAAVSTSKYIELVACANDTAVSSAASCPHSDHSYSVQILHVHCQTLVYRPVCRRDCCDCVECTHCCSIVFFGILPRHTITSNDSAVKSAVQSAADVVYVLLIDAKHLSLTLHAATTTVSDSLNAGYCINTVITQNAIAHPAIHGIS